MNARQSALTFFLLGFLQSALPPLAAGGEPGGADGVSPRGCDPAMSLLLSSPGGQCVQAGETFDVTLRMTCPNQPVYGFQAFLSFDPAVLQFESGSYVASTFGLPVIPITAANGQINMIAGIDSQAGQQPVSTDADLAILTFSVVGSGGSTSVDFRHDFLPSRLTGADGQPIATTVNDSAPVLVDDEGPALTCPQDVTIECDESHLPANTGNPTAIDECDPSPSVSFEDDIEGDGCARTITRTWTAIDATGNASTCVQVIDQNDSIPPALVCPADVVVECGESTEPSNTGTATATDNCDPAPVVTYEDDPVGGCSAALVRTWTAVDTCGLVSVCTQIVDDACAIPPTLELSVSNGGNPCVRPGDSLQLTLSMACLPAPVRGFQAFLEFDPAMMGFNNGSYIIPGPFNRPILAPITASGGQINLAAGIDDANGQPLASADADLVRLNFVAGMTEGATTIGFRGEDYGSRFSDENGQPIVPELIDAPTIFIDGSPPVYACSSDITTNSDPGLCGAFLNIQPPNVVDPGGSGVESIQAGRSDGLELTDPFPVGETFITWNVTDCAGNSTTCEQTVTIADNELPVIACPADVSGVFAPIGACELPIVIETPLVSDNCGIASVTNDFNGSNDASDSYPVGETVITWTVTDVHGNAAQCTHTVTVNDIERPAIACPPNLTQNTDPDVCGGTVTVPQPDIEDNCTDVTVVNNFNGTDDASDLYPAGTTQVRWTVTDSNGNTAQCTHTITVIDDEAPGVTCPPTVTESTDPGVCHANVTVPVLIAFDACFIDTVTNDRNGTANASGVYPVGTTPVTWTATDFNGNATSCSHDVIVTDDEPPSIACPPDVRVSADVGTNSAFVEIPPPIAADACGLDFYFNDYTGTADASGTYPAGTTDVTWTAVDVYGNTNSCVQQVTVNQANDLAVTVQLSPFVSGPFTRCITFELFDCSTGTPVVLEEELDFDMNGIATAVLAAPVGTYSCITARDKLHTLRRTDEGFGVVDGQYVADFTGNPLQNGDWLVGGNLNDDRFIDILDFGIFVNQFATDYGSADTPCGTTGRHADVSGNGVADIPDFTFIQVNFLEFSEPNCCGLGGRTARTDGAASASGDVTSSSDMPDAQDEREVRRAAGARGVQERRRTADVGQMMRPQAVDPPAGRGPLESVPVGELSHYGLPAFVDLNADGVLDQHDMAAFMQGVRPTIRE